LFQKNGRSIQGKNDKMLPISANSKIDFRIKDGGNLMVYNRAKEIEEILRKLVLKLKK
jgi:hypothetical protein